MTGSTDEVHEAKDAKDAKAALRRAVRARRAAWTPGHASEVGDAIGRGLERWSAWRAVEAPAMWVTFCALPGEPDLVAASRRARDAGHRVAYPRVVGDALVFSTVPDERDLVPGPFGLREPPGSVDELRGWTGVALVLVPGLAFDERGKRLGHGRGYYDRALASMDAHAGPRLVVGVTAREFVVERVPTEAHDRAVRWLATEDGVVAAAGSARG